LFLSLNTKKKKNPKVDFLLSTQSTKLKSEQLTTSKWKVYL
jgi:hypothetical protein